MDSWILRTFLSDAEAKEWSVIAACHQQETCVFVVFFTDGELRWSIEGELHSDWTGKSGAAVQSRTGMSLLHPCMVADASMHQQRR